MKAIRLSGRKPLQLFWKPIHLSGLILSLFLGFATESSAMEQTFWQNAVKKGQIVIMRHALAPGNGDPNNFDINNCSTQRNLSDQGLRQARAIGESIRSAGIKDMAIYSSLWCRCVDTATEMAIGTPVEEPLLNSFYNNRADGPAQIKALKTWLEDKRHEDKTMLLVTHQVVITALTGVFPASGEAVSFTLGSDGTITVVDQLTIDP